MSIKVMTYVWEGFPGGGSELLAMLAMADWCDDRGNSLYPSMKAVAEKIRLSEKQARRIIRSFEESGFLIVVGNAYGGAPGATKQFRVNVQMLKNLAAKKDSTPPAHGNPTTPVHGSPTPPVDVTPPTEGTPPAGVPDASHGCPSTPPTGGSLTTIEPPLEPPSSEVPAAPPLELVPDEPVEPKKKKPEDAQETALQAACRATWMAYSAEYAIKYGIPPIRNAKLNTNVKSFVQRIGHDEAPAVAAFFVSRVSDAYVVRKMHEFGLLLSSAESYRTQWATNQAMTSTRAGQIDKTQSNFDAAGEAMAILRSKREKTDA